MSGALAIARMGSFFAGGRVLRLDGRPRETVRISETVQAFERDPNGHYAIEACYVQYAVPEPVRGAPWLLIHGGGLAGSSWESTPDGRPGWQELLLRRGHPVYVVDMVERGRAGWCPLDGVWEGTPILRTMEEAWDVFRIGPAEGFAERRSFAGQRFPVEAFDSFAHAGVPRWPGATPAAQAALTAALDRIGPCVVLAHSTGSGHAYGLARERPELVEALAVLEPAHLPDIYGPPDTPVLHVHGDYIVGHPFWRDLEARADAYLAALAAAGGTAAALRLNDRGMPGHSHMMMMDHDNDAVLDLVREGVAGLTGGPAPASAADAEEGETRR